MRIAAIEKIGFYPTPPETLQLIRQCLVPAVPDASLRLLDPCAGEGIAIEAVAHSLSDAGAIVTSCAVEVSDTRAAALTGRVSHAICADWKEITLSNQSCSLLWLNPPYDWEAGNAGEFKNRLEYIFLKDTIRSLQDDGVLVYLVPQRLLGQVQIARFLSSNFAEIEVYRLPDGEYEQFGQVVLFGRCRPKPMRDASMQARLVAYGEGTEPLPVLAAGCTQITLSPTPIDEDRFFIRKKSLSPDEVIQTVASHGVHRSKAWQDVQNRHADGRFQPVVPLRTGHVGSLISSGQMGTVQLGALLAKGRSAKSNIHLDKQGNRVIEGSENAATIQERFTTRVFTLTKDGEYTVIEDSAGMQQFLESHAGAIARIIEDRYAPLYQEPTPEEWATLGPLLRHKLLPGRKIGGLLPAQKHVAIAAARAAKKLGYADIVGEMGVGKTCVSLASVELLNAYPALVICPGHMVEKWAREATEVAGAQGVVINSLEALGELIRSYRPGDKVVAVMSKERAKLGSGWRPAVNKKTIKVIHPSADDTGLPVEELRTVFTCPSCGGVITDSDGVSLTEMPKKRLFCTSPVRHWQGDADDNSKGKWVEGRCNAPLFTYAGYRRWPLADVIRKQHPHFFKILLADECHQYKGKATDQAESYHHLHLATKYTLNLTGTLFGGKSTDLFWQRYRVDAGVRRDYDFHDEIRWAQHYGRLEMTLNKQTEEEDGSFSGKKRYVTRSKEIPGISPGIFHRLLTSCIFVRVADLGFTLPSYDETVIHLDMAPTQRAQYDWLYNTLYDHISSCMKSYDRGARKEASKLLSVWLQNSLSRPNSAFRPELVTWKPPGIEKQPFERLPYLVPDLPNFDEDSEAVGDANEDLAETLWQSLVGESPANASQEQQDRLAAFEQMLDQWRDNLELAHEEPMALYPVVNGDELLPKEAWLVEYCQEEVAARRKSIVYVRQTGTRDIQPRLKQILLDAGIRAEILPDHIKPARREEWIQAHARDMDVLLTNPMKVATGLDLIMFSTCIFYELDYSLFTLWQAMRRVWRLGQQKPVKVMFPVYNDSMESAALALMGQKMQAALLLYGDNASSAITDEVGGSGDFLSELAHKVLAGEALTSDGITGLLAQTIPEPVITEQDEDTEDALIFDEPEPAQILTLPTKPARRQEDLTQVWEVYRQQAAQVRAQKRPSRRRKKVAEEQMSLFAMAA